MTEQQRESIIEKIKKCLSLSKSSNENEAAVALEQARKLMEKYNIDMSDVEKSEINQFTVAGGLCVKPPMFEVILVNSIAKMYGCTAFSSLKVHNGRVNSMWNFAGYGPSAEIASYTFSVLYRKLRSARNDFIKATFGKDATRKEKIDAGDSYCVGWVYSAIQTIIDIKEDEETVKKLKDSLTLTTGSNKSKDISEYLKNASAVNAGVADGKNVELHVGVSGEGNNSEAVAEIETTKVDDSI